jgi:hypothetical protein
MGHKTKAGLLKGAEGDAMLPTCGGNLALVGKVQAPRPDMPSARTMSRIFVEHREIQHTLLTTERATAMNPHVATVA